MTVSPPPEYDLLLDAIAPLETARTNPTAWDGGRWGRALQVADWHRLSPILFCHLDSGGQAPAAVLSALERAYLANAARSLFIASALLKVVDTLDAAGVPVMLLKGAALVDTVYDDPAQREMLDLDLLVPADQLRGAEEALAAVGYRPLQSDGDPDTATRAVQLNAHHDAPLVGEEQVVAVELHRHIAIGGEGSDFKIDGIWERARPAADRPHLLPSPEDLLSHVCLHFTRNRLGGSHIRRNTGGALGQISDIARLVEREPIDWDALVATARADRLETRVFLGLFAARELGVPVPESAVSKLQPSGFDRAVGRRLVALRVLRDGDHLPVRSMRWMFAPSREVLTRGWNADPTATVSLARAYLRRARANVPLARSALRRPWAVVQDRRLNSQIRALEERM